MQTDIDTAFSPTERRDLPRILGIMIPASEAYGMPGADDPAIFADIVGSAGRDLGEVKAALAELAAEAGAELATLDAARLEPLVLGYLARSDLAATALSRVVLQCYYRDDRVLLALGHEPRAPFPNGHRLEQGDWSLLDAVRHRPQLWRDDRTG